MQRAHAVASERRVALVTGAASGIGRATAVALARSGAHVVLADRDASGGEVAAREAAELGRPHGARAEFVPTDVADPHAVTTMVARAVDLFGGIDLAVNNAGIEGVLAPIVDHPAEAWHRVLAVNLTGVFLCLQAEIPALRRRGGGAIVNVSSILGLVGHPGAPAYTAAKHGVLGLTKVAALELAADRIRVNAICPGYVETPMVMERGVHLAADRDAYDRAAALHPLGRLGTPEEIAAAILWLGSDAASFITGAVVPVDGGYLAR